MYEEPDPDEYEGLGAWEQEPIEPIEEEDTDGGVEGTQLECGHCRFRFITYDLNLTYECPNCRSIIHKDNN
jgi:uncharacterized CHY-type Zn-finger protein